MRHPDRLRRFLLALPLLLAAAPLLAAPQSPTRGAVFAMDNALEGNQVVSFVRDPTGMLIPRDRTLTGGSGTGMSLSSQGSLVLSRDSRRLFAVNAGSNQLSLFSVTGDGLLLTDVVDSGGSTPISVALFADLAYVLHAGPPSTLVGFRHDASGQLQPIPDSVRILGDADLQPAQAGFSPLGDQLLVTLRASNQIALLPVSADGLLSSRFLLLDSVGETPFGFGFKGQSNLIVSEAFGGKFGASAVSSYILGPGTLTPISESVPTGQTAACWIASATTLPFVYTSNTGSHTITGFLVGVDGMLTELPGPSQSASDTVATVATGKAPTDMAFARGGTVLYVLNSGSGSISGYSVQLDGSLILISETPGLPTVGASGLAAF